MIDLTALEGRVATEMGMTHAVLFDRARTAVSAFYNMMHPPRIRIPTNVCPALLAAIWGITKTELVPVDVENGLAIGVPVHLYGWRQDRAWSLLEIDPLMTGCVRARGTQHCLFRPTIISFGYSKTIDIGGGGAFVTNDPTMWVEMRKHANFPRRLIDPLNHELGRLGENIGRRRDRLDIWNRLLEPLEDDELLIKPPAQVIPWRCIRRLPKYRDEVVQALRAAGIDGGTNYPPLADKFTIVKDSAHSDSTQWGNEVLNLWVTEDYDAQRIAKACSVIGRTLDRAYRKDTRQEQQKLDEHHAIGNALRP